MGNGTDWRNNDGISKNLSNFEQQQLLNNEQILAKVAQN